jgi:Kef-type K+ transport system membrane component KefB
MPDLIADILQFDWPAVPEMPVWAALALIAAALIGELMRRGFGLPRVLGYSIVGLVIGAAGAGGLTMTTRTVVDLALALLLFELGYRVRLSWLRANPALLLTSVAETGASFAAIYFALRWFDQSAGVALACATLGTCASGAVVARVAHEMKAAGQVTERMIVLTALNTLVAVLALKLVIGWLDLQVAGDWLTAVSQPLRVFSGSTLVAALLAALVAWIARHLDLTDENAALLLLGLVMLALTAAQLFNLSTLLVPLLAGVLLRNGSERPWVWPRHFGTAGGVLVLMMFVIAGSAFTVDAVMVGGLAALVMLGARALAKGSAVILLAPWSGLRLRQGLGLALTLTPMSGTVLVLLLDLQGAHPHLAGWVTPIILSAIAFTDVLGPIAVQCGLALAREHHPVPAWPAHAATMELA